ncbi:MAG: family 20 glycosylhydrolase [Rhodopirellula sp.]|nr:family 20 glycosylhydrolase [Rhodopirellula sp.]
MAIRPVVAVLCLLAANRGGVVQAERELELRLVPFPKQVRQTDGTFPLDRSLVFEAPETVATRFAHQLGQELSLAGMPVPETVAVAGRGYWFRLAKDGGGRVPSAPQYRDGAGEEDYVLNVGPEEIICIATGEEGLYYGLQTVRQLIRANRLGNALPNLAIADWPSLRWRCFQDDMTRGPSSKLGTLEDEVALGSELKMNLFTYYMEHQYAFKKHPLIGPENGSLTPEDLAALVDYAKPLYVDILGNQQSFGHFGHILAHDRYAHLRETPSLLSPVAEDSYRLLDDFYSEVCPLLPFPWFNVCCDETWGLGEGPSKQLAEEIGVGGVYVRHVRRVHDLLKDKYDKRMMMWGDIILQHPDKLDQVPKDTIMLTWGYGPRESFEHQILPFVELGYEFFVCPGVSNWSRILPDFGVATTNIGNFVRDGAKHGALGMLNTAWEDDGEALNAPKWHGYAWGAECAWNASTTSPEQFSRRIGAVLFGEKADHFGRAIELLARTHALPGMSGMNNKRFWENDFVPQRKPAAVVASAERLLGIVRPAIEQLQTCHDEATVNQELLDHFLFGARRMERIGQRMLDGLEAVQSYAAAYQLPAADSLPRLQKIESLVRQNRDAHAALGRDFERLWLSESKPYALDRVLDRYAAAVKWYDDVLLRLADARKQAEAGRPLPSPEAVGLAMPEHFARRTRPHRIVPTPLAPDAPWADTAATHRLGLVVQAGAVDRAALPIEVDVRLPEPLVSQSARAFCAVGDESPREIPVQVDPGCGDVANARLTMALDSPISQGRQALIQVYLGLPSSPPLVESVAATGGPEDGVWIENGKVRLLLGPEGGHVYRWEVKARDYRDLTMPGESGWAGFSDVHSHRGVKHQLDCLARGPALVRYRVSAPDGLAKTISLFAGCSWMEIVLDNPVTHYWDFDDPKNFAADGPEPGRYLFSDGSSGAVAKQADGVPGQVEQAGTFWGIKFNDDRLALGLATPEVAALHHIAPGAGAGGVGIEASPAAGHFITFAGVLESEPAETMNRLCRTLDFRSQPEVALYAIQEKP